MSPVSEPSGWPRVKATYDESMSVKLQTDAKDDGTPVTQMDRLEAIEYWMSRLLTDAVAIARKGKPDRPGP